MIRKKKKEKKEKESKENKGPNRGDAMQSPVKSEVPGQREPPAKRLREDEVKETPENPGKHAIKKESKAGIMCCAACPCCGKELLVERSDTMSSISALLSPSSDASGTGRTARSLDFEDAPWLADISCALFSPLDLGFDTGGEWQDCAEAVHGCGEGHDRRDDQGQ